MKLHENVKKKLNHNNCIVNIVVASGKKRKEFGTSVSLDRIQIHNTMSYFLKVVLN